MIRFMVSWQLRIPWKHIVNTVAALLCWLSNVSPRWSLLIPKVYPICVVCIVSNTNECVCLEV